MSYLKSEGELNDQCGKHCSIMSIGADRIDHEMKPYMFDNVIHQD